VARSGHGALATAALLRPRGSRGFAQVKSGAVADNLVASAVVARRGAAAGASVIADVIVARGHGDAREAARLGLDWAGPGARAVVQVVRAEARAIVPTIVAEVGAGPAAR
jgi:hypothetical protein